MLLLLPLSGLLEKTLLPPLLRLWASRTGDALRRMVSSISCLAWLGVGVLVGWVEIVYVVGGSGARSGQDGVRLGLR